MRDTKSLINQLENKGVTLVAVSKTKPSEQILEVYDLGQRDFGENRVQEMVDKAADLPNDIRWHQIGHLQKNKVKYIAPFVHLIHSIDSEALLKTVQKEAAKNDRKINVLLQLKIATEETKYGLSTAEAEVLTGDLISGKYPNVYLQGFMGMASFVQEDDQVEKEFSGLKNFQSAMKEQFPDDMEQLQVLSMGMSGDYNIAIECGSTMVRIGSAIFGSRN
ncbi:MAG: YggS family pyridoxal phosphate-dependent enzyme [Bacteroidota bacterium]